MVAGSPRLSLCMIVRDEARNLPRCLGSARGVWDELIVVDTGSLDGTREVARRFGAQVLEFAWCDDFAAARNHGLERARGDWILWLDADDELPPGAVPCLRSLLSDGTHEGFLIPTTSLLGQGPGGPSVTCLHLRLFRNRPHYRFRGAIHEQVTCEPRRCAVRDDVYVLHRGYEADPDALRRKAGRNRRILERLLAHEPENPWYLYHLGTECLRLGDPGQAVVCYQRAREGALRARMPLAELWKKLAVALLEQGDLDAAQSVLDEGMGLFPDYTDLVFAAGTLAHRRGRPGEALRLYLRCLQMGDAPLSFPRDNGLGGHRTHHALALVHFSLGNYREAAGCALRALAAAPADPSPLEVAVQALTAVALPEEVIHQLEGHIEITPPAALYLSRLLAAAGDYQSALYFLRRAGKAGAPGVRALLAGICHLGLGRVARARAALQQASTAGPAGDGARRHLALVRWLAGEARSQDMDAVAPTPLAQVALLEKLLELGRLRAARAALGWLAASNDPDIRAAAGLACLRQGWYREAYRLLSGTPSSAPAGRVLAAAGAGMVAAARRELGTGTAGNSGTDPEAFSTFCAHAWALLTAAGAVLEAAPGRTPGWRRRLAALRGLPLWCWHGLSPAGPRAKGGARRARPAAGRRRQATAFALHDRPG